MRRGLIAAGCGLLLAACGSSTPGDEPAAGPAALQLGSASASPVPWPQPSTSPLSGRPGGVDAPVVVVKLDNTRNAQPHVNLVEADMVYVEPVEWGLTRLAAVFSSRIPQVVGPVRSARISDIAVFAPFGDAAFVFSGAQQKLVPKLLAADWTPVCEDLDGPGFHRDHTRLSPYNLMADPREILSQVGPVATAHDMGLVFSQEPLVGGQRAKEVTARWPGSMMRFRWRARTHAYEVWLNGAQMRDTALPGVQRASTVIVQYVEEIDSHYGDRDGGRTPRTIMVGSGGGLVLRDGRAHRVTWQRRRAADPTVYRDESGGPIALAPGQVWVVLMDRNREVTIDRPVQPTPEAAVA